MTIFSKGEKTSSSFSPDECVFRFIAGGWRGERTGGKWTLERSDKFLPRGASRKQTVRNNCVAAAAAAARITVPKREEEGKRRAIFNGGKCGLEYFCV